MPKLSNSKVSSLLPFIWLVPFLIELFLQLISFGAGGTILWLGGKSESLVWFLLSIVPSIIVTKAVMLVLSALFIRWLPKPQIGMFHVDSSEMHKFFIQSCVSKFARRSIISEDFYLMPFPGQIYYKLCGSKLGKQVRIASNFSIPDSYLVEIGDNTFVGEGVIVSGHFIPDVNTLVIGTVKIGKDVLLGAYSHIWPNVTIGNGAIVQENSSVQPGTIINANEIWGGNPAKLIWSPNSSSVIEGQIGSRNSSETFDYQIKQLIINYVKTTHQIDLDESQFHLPILMSGLLDSISLFELFAYLESHYKVSMAGFTNSIRTLTFAQIVEDFKRDQD